MKYLILLLFLSSCTIKAHRIVEPSNLTTRCLRTLLLPDADPGGTWSVIEPEFALPLSLAGDNPCVNLAAYGCGLYEFKYLVESTTCAGCKDSSIVNVNYQLTIIGTTTCNH